MLSSSAFWFYLNGVGYKGVCRCHHPALGNMFYLNGVGYKVF